VKPREANTLWCCLGAALVIAAIVYTVLTWWFDPPGQVTLPPQPTGR